METFDHVSGLHNCIEFSQTSSCLDELLKDGKSSLLLNQNMDYKLARAADKQILDACDFILFQLLFIVPISNTLS